MRVSSNPTKSNSFKKTGKFKNPPPLNPGDYLSRTDFERLYKAHPEIKKAELIEGVVYMASPARFKEHANPLSDLKV